MLQALNIFFFVFHSLWMVFNMTAWAWRRTRPWHLLTLGLTGLSWFVLGYWYGWGYCICTDWHLQVRHELGYWDDRGSYIFLLINQLTGLQPSIEFCNMLALSVFSAALLLSVSLSVRDWLRSRTRRGTNDTSRER
jgi:hypothetical protein